MRPFHSLLFLLAVFLMLLAIIWVWPQKGIAINDNTKLKFVTVSELFEVNKVQYANIDHIVAAAGNFSSTNGYSASYSDSIPFNLEDTVRYSADSLRKVTYKLQFGQNDRNILVPVFEALENGGQTVRILHYGDSQIEGDRISSFLRHKLQRQFGGGGPGLLSLAPVIQATVSTKHEYSNNWKRYVIFGQSDTLLTHKKYGAMIAYTRFSDDTIVHTDSIHAWHKLTKSGAAYPDAVTFSQLSIYYGRAKQPVNVRILNGDSILANAVMPSGQGLQVLRYNFKKPVADVKLEFSSLTSPDFYGMALDKFGGVAVDNLPLRGSSGLEFTRSDLDFMGQMYRQMNVKMLILQFGVNVVPNVVDDYAFYENWFYRQIVSIRKYNPNIPIIVIGVSDMARKEGDYYISYPNIGKIRDAQRAAAFRADCAFWDMFEAMGGENSMPSWAFAKPPLAAKDFTHFNYQGSRIIAEMFYNAFDFEFRAWRNKTDKSFEPRYLREKPKHF